MQKRHHLAASSDVATGRYLRRTEWKQASVREKGSMHSFEFLFRQRSEAACASPISKTHDLCCNLATDSRGRSRADHKEPESQARSTWGFLAAISHRGSSFELELLSSARPTRAIGGCTVGARGRDARMAEGNSKRCLDCVGPIRSHEYGA